MPVVNEVVGVLFDRADAGISAPEVVIGEFIDGVAEGPCDAEVAAAIVGGDVVCILAGVEMLAASIVTEDIGVSVVLDEDSEDVLVGSITPSAWFSRPHTSHCLRASMSVGSVNESIAVDVVSTAATTVIEAANSTDEINASCADTSTAKTLSQKPRNGAMPPSFSSPDVFLGVLAIQSVHSL